MQNYRVLAQNDLTRWAERFLSTLEQGPDKSAVRLIPRTAAGR
jgi:hypothetical protein